MNAVRLAAMVGRLRGFAPCNKLVPVIMARSGRRSLRLTTSQRSHLRESDQPKAWRDFTTNAVNWNQSEFTAVYRYDLPIKLAPQ
jgi:hypothetical protein